MRLQTNKLFQHVITSYSIHYTKLYEIGAVEVFKQNAIELMASQQQNKRLLDLAGEGIFGLDAKGKFIFVNPTASKLLGS